MSVVRFFTILFRDWTYEVDYKLEVWRLVLNNLITLGVPFVLFRIPNIPFWILLLSYITCVVCWWYYNWCSLSRFMQINTNRKYAKNVTKEQIVEIINAYPNKVLYCKVNGQYKQIKKYCEVNSGDSILLITIGKKQLIDLKKIKKILEENESEKTLDGS